MADIVITSIQVKDDFLSNVLQTALDAGYTHGIGYWADWGHVTADKSDKLVKVEIFDRDTDKKYTLERSDVLRGILSALNHGHKSVLDTDNLDGPTSDIILQCACFNEVLYG